MSTTRREQRSANGGTATDDRVINVVQECPSTGLRSTGERLRHKILNAVRESGQNVAVDFTGVSHATSSFLDEALGRLAYEMGEDFDARIDLRNMPDTIDRMARNVVTQRLHGLDTEDDQATED
jgi:hypothetical protein